MRTETTTSDGRSLLLGSGALFLGTVVLRGWGLGKPATFVFDEIFYVNDALDLVTHGVEKTFVGHPPLGKWLIGLGFLSGEFTPFTWRVASLIAGAVVVALTFAIGARVSRSTAVGAIAAILVLTDGIAHTTGRLAMLDGFAALFTTAVLAVLIFTRGEPFRAWTAVVLGALCGAAIATKWSTAPALLVVLLICLMRSRRDATLGRGFTVAAGIVGTAVLVYFASYGAWVIGGAPSGNCSGADCPASFVGRLTQLPKIQGQMLRSEMTYRREDVQHTPGWRWILQDEATVLFDERCNGGDDGVCEPGSGKRFQVVAKGNIIMWFAVLPLLGIWFLRGARGHPTTTGMSLIAAWVLTLWLPWAIFTKTYTYYGAPLVPVIALGVALATFDMLSPRLAAIILGLGAVAAIVAFAGSHPGLPWEL